MSEDSVPSPWIYAGSKKGARGAHVVELLRPALEQHPHAPLCIPFLGGGGVFLQLAAAGLLAERRVWVTDACGPVINAWRAMHTVPVALEALIEDFSGMAFYDLRDTFNAEAPQGVAQAARFLLLNRLCQLGLVRFGPNGFNVPTGPRDLDRPRHVPALLEGVRRTGVLLAPLDLTLARVSAEVVIPLMGLLYGQRGRSPAPLVLYCDPVYLGTFGSYVHMGEVDEGWTRALYRSIGELPLLPGSVAVVSNSVEGGACTGAGWVHHATERSGRINADTSQRQPVGEVDSVYRWPET